MVPSGSIWFHLVGGFRIHLVSANYLRPRPAVCLFCAMAVCGLCDTDRERNNLEDFKVDELGGSLGGEEGG